MNWGTTKTRNMYVDIKVFGNTLKNEIMQICEANKLYWKKLCTWKEIPKIFISAWNNGNMNKKK